MKHAPIIVSACLAGIYCRYSGEGQSFEPVVDLIRQGRAIPFCPEVFGGLPTPRLPCEIQGGCVVDSDGIDRTAEFRRGAEEGLRLARLAGCTEAILKAYSPSCGSGIIYDGTFSSTRIPGDGLFAELLKKNGILVRSEEDVFG
ncbi:MULTISPECIES: DUF523 domain-containing protein [unclassified Pseudodesulfovibrio]|uniref:DUF523 domain-containing protein n=1 Tax=unclassified Pseudodesulfovibrio TaxID=2661612 RepID=UPI000FEC0AEB|nr:MULTISPECIES: DUF523 domain-containing protein [unclassified Pseudodesulfovibrio]MCJ2165444.1 DUF523 domain-containing protein [Pseudodesulfovibrio sp. S3-i]RWU03194.1 DUF523 domain-containing protein [Pseudodesulfovibrio sp. S3]